MKVAVSAGSDSPEGNVTPVFGRCAGFLILEVEDGEIKKSEFVENAGINAAGGAGMIAANTVAGKGVEAVLTGNMGPNAFGPLDKAGIKVYSAGGMKITEAVAKLAKGGLEEIKEPGEFGRGKAAGTMGAQ